MTATQDGGQPYQAGYPAPPYPGAAPHPGPYPGAAPYPGAPYGGGPAYGQPPFGGLPTYPPMAFAPPPAKTRFGGLAIAALVLGIIGTVGSIVPVLNTLSAVLAVVGGILGVVALFGSRKVMAAIGVVLAVLAVILSVVVTGAFVKAVDDSVKKSAPVEQTGGTVRFGETVTFGDGSTLRVEKPVTFTPDRFAITGAKKPVYVKFKATFVNKTGKTYDPSLTTGSASAAGEEGESVFQDGLGAPSNKVLPGKSVTWWSGYGVPSQKDLQLEISMGFLDYDTVVFTG